jgi:hypothetical protein
MRLHRKVILALAALLVLGSLGFTTGYGLNLRGERFRLQTESALSSFFELPCEVGRIRGHTFSSRLFEEVSVWLPDRRDKVFQCERAIWSEAQREGREVNALELQGGVLVLGTDRWKHEDYRQVLRSGLGHDFEDLGLSRVELGNFEILFDRGKLRILCRQTSGRVSFENGADGVAQLRAYEFNGLSVPQGVQIHARFSPHNGLEVSNLLLSLPRIPISAVGLERVFGAAVSSGQFEGSVEYLNPGSAPEIRVRGELSGADLREMTGKLPLGPFEGKLTVTVSDSRVVGQAISRLRGRGELRDLVLAPFGPLLGEGDLHGRASIQFDEVEFAADRLAKLSIGGELSDLSLEQWLRPWGKGTATGALSVRINNLEIFDEMIRSADVELRAIPPPGGLGVIDRSLLLSLAEKALHFTWPSRLPQTLLPERVEYVEFGMRLLVRDNQLRILGTHGPGGNVILTIRMLGQPIGIVREQPGRIDLTPTWQLLLARLRALGDMPMSRFW